MYLEGRYLGGGRYTNDRDTAGVLLVARADGTNDIAPQFLLSASANYTLWEGDDGKRAQLFGAVRNITNNFRTAIPLPTS